MGRNRKKGWVERMEGKLKRKLSEVNTRAVSRGLNEWIGMFKMVVGDVINIGG
jgi:hypothetical protein